MAVGQSVVIHATFTWGLGAMKLKRNRTKLMEAQRLLTLGIVRAQNGGSKPGDRHHQNNLIAKNNWENN